MPRRFTIYGNGWTDNIELEGPVTIELRQVPDFGDVVEITADNDDFAYPDQDVLDIVAR